MGKKIWQYPEATEIQEGDYALIDSVDEGSRKIPVSLIKSKLISKTVTERGTYKASDDEVNGYSEVNVNVPFTNIHVKSGDIVTFDDGEDLPLASLKVGIEPIQSGSGDPSPTNVRPISGWSEADVYDDPVYGGTIEWNQLMPISSRATSTVNDVLITNNEDGSFTLNGTASGNIYGDIYSNFQNTLTTNHIYMFVANSTANTVRIINSYGGLNISTIDKKIVKYTSGNVYIALYVNSGIVVDNVSIYPQCLDLTAIFGETKAEEILAMEQTEAGSGVSYVSNLFPHTYYAYNTGTKTCVSEVNNGTYRHYNIPFLDSQGNPVEVFGGECDVVNGGENNKTTLASVDLATVGAIYNSGWGCWVINSLPNAKLVDSNNTPTNAMTDRFKAVKASGYTSSHEVNTFAQNTSGVWFFDNGSSTEISGQLVYELAIPSTFTSQPTSIKSIEGVNNVWADTGDIEELAYQTVWHGENSDSIERLCYVEYVGRDSEEIPTISTKIDGLSFSEYLSYSSSTKKFTVLQSFNALVVPWVYQYDEASSTRARGQFFINNTKVIAVQCGSTLEGEYAGKAFAYHFSQGDTFYSYTPSSDGYPQQFLKIYNISGIPVDKLKDALDYINETT